MSLSCDYNGDDCDAEWYWNQPTTEAPLATKRSRKCCSCGEKILPGHMAREITRHRPPSERCNYIEESIYGDEVPLASWYFCDPCSDLAESLAELGFCYTMGEPLKQQIAEYRAEEATYNKRTAP